MGPYTILLKKIQSGEFPVGSRLASERLLAEKLLVSRAAIRGAISRLADEGWLETRPGFRPVVTAKPGTPAQSKTIALLVGSETTYYPFSQILRGCETELRRHGHLLAFMDTWAETPHDPAERGNRENEALIYLSRQNIQGIILWCQDPTTSLPLLRGLQENNVGVVTIDREVPQSGFDHVGVDNFRLAMEVADYLVRSGHRRIAFVAVHNDNASTVRQREAGFLYGLQSQGIAAPLILRLPFRASVEQIASELATLKQNKAEQMPTAYFVMNDLYALRLIQALQSVGIDVPGDASVVGFDDMEPDYRDGVNLTTVRQPFFDIGREAVRTLLRRLAEPDASACQVLLAAPLIERNTVRCLIPAKEHVS